MWASHNFISLAKQVIFDLGLKENCEIFKHFWKTLWQDLKNSNVFMLIKYSKT